MYFKGDEVYHGSRQENDVGEVCEESTIMIAKVAELHGREKLWVMLGIENVWKSDEPPCMEEGNVHAICVT